jgi:hypothetical protein
MWHVWGVWGREDVNTGFWWGRQHLDYLGIRRALMFNFILKKSDGRAWSRLLWLRIDTIDGLL